MKKKRILVDMDCILTDFNIGAIVAYNKHTGSRLDPMHADTLLSEFGPEGLSKDIDFKTLKDTFRQPGFFLHLPVMLDSQEAIARLEKAGHEVIICTAPMEKGITCLYEKQVWVDIHFPSLKEKIVCTELKYLVRGDALVDDRPKHLKAWKEENPKGITASLKYPWSDPTHTDILSTRWLPLAEKLLSSLEG